MTRDNSSSRFGEYCSKRNGKTGKHCTEGELTLVPLTRFHYRRGSIKVSMYYCPHHLQVHNRYIAELNI